MNKSKVQKLIQMIQSANNIAIIMHHNPDGDAIGSGSGLCELIHSNLNKKTQLFYSGKIPMNLSGLPHVDVAINTDTNKNRMNFDLAISVDTATPNMMSDDTLKLFNGATHSVMIDHHAAAVNYADLNIVEHSPAAAQVIYQIAKMAGWKISPTVANALYTGIVSDTGKFSYTDHSDTYRVAADLVDLGAKARDIAITLDTKTKESAILNAQIVANAEFYFENRLAIGTVTKKQYSQLDGKGSHALITLKSIDTVTHVALILQPGDNDIYISLRGKLPVTKWANELNGGGHEFAAGAKMKGTLATAKKRVIAAFEKSQIKTK